MKLLAPVEFEYCILGLSELTDKAFSRQDEYQ